MEVKFIRTTSARIDNLPVTNGQLIYLEDVSQAYYDLDDSRHELTSGSSQLSELTDVDLSQLSSGQVLKYNATSQKWENSTDSRELTQLQYDNLSQAEKMNGTTYFITDGTSPSGSGGHEITDASGSTFAQRGILQFENGWVSDDPTNDATVVNSDNFIGTREQWDAKSSAEKAKYKSYDLTNEVGYYPLDFGKRLEAQTLAVGSTSLTFTDAAITSYSTVLPFSNVFGMYPLDIDTSTEGQATVVFDPQPVAASVYLVIR